MSDHQTNRGGLLACGRLLALLLAIVVLSATADAEVVVDFDELSLFNGSAVPPGTGQYFDGYGIDAETGAWSSKGVSFNTSQFLGGWSYGNVLNTTTAGFTNQWASFPGNDLSGGGNYAIANSFDANSAFINLPDNHRIESVHVSNSTFTALSMLQGDSFAKRFGGASGNDPDFLSVVFTGFSGLDALGSETGSQSFLLADYRFEDNSLDFIVDDWAKLDLSGLANAKSIGVSFRGSDTGDFGLNTPAYVALDNLVIAAVPEPSAAVLFPSAFITYVLLRRLKRGALRSET